jgi:prolyl-tRNA synthetase
MRGVCIRVDVGGRELEAGELGVSRRDLEEKMMVPVSEIVETVVSQLTEMQGDLFAKALAFRDSNIHRVDTWEDFAQQFAGEGGGGFVLAHWDGTAETEAKISEETKATIRCIPMVHLLPSDSEPGKCFMTGQPSKQRVVFAKAY